jgi:outer membrane protein
MHKLTIFLLFILVVWTTGQHVWAFDPDSNQLAASSEASWPSSPLTLEQTIARALAQNPEIAAKGWEAEAAQARISAASGARRPRLALTGNYMHHLDEQRLIPAASDGSPGLFGRDILMADVVVTLPLYAGGRLTHQIAASELLHEASLKRLARSRDELIFNVTSLYTHILAQHQLIVSLEFSATTLARHVERVDRLIKAGKAARVERLRTQVRLADIQQLLVRERNLLHLQQRALAGLLGIRGGGDHPLVAGELENGFTDPIPEFSEVLKRTPTTRSDYRAALLAFNAQERQLDAVRAGHLPSLSLQGSYGSRWAVGSTTGNGSDQADVGRIGLVLEIPLYSGGQVSAGVAEQRALLAAARARLHTLEQQIALEVETAIRNLAAAAERGRALQQTLELAHESLQIEQQKYELGKGAIIDVLDAQTALLQAESSYYRVLADYHTAQAQLTLAVGE